MAHSEKSVKYGLRHHGVIIPNVADVVFGLKVERIADWDMGNGNRILRILQWQKIFGTIVTYQAHRTDHKGTWRLILDIRKMIKPYYQDTYSTIYLGNCLKIMSGFDSPIDMILADLPYGITACHWDKQIPLEPLWKQYKRLIKDNGAIVLTASQPFTSTLVMSNPEMFKYEWIWGKSIGANPLLCKKQPMKYHENILVFYDDLTNRKQQIEQFDTLRSYFKSLQTFIKLNKKQILDKIGQGADHCFRWNSSQWDLPTEKTYCKLINVFDINRWQGFRDYTDLKREYLFEENAFKTVTFNPQMTKGKLRDKQPKMSGKKNDENWAGAMREIKGNKNINDLYYPRSYQYIPNANQKDKFHPTEKPVALFEYLIKTYTNEGDTVLDNVMGSGTTLVAAKQLNRKSIGIEIEEKYCEIAVNRIEKAIKRDRMSFQL